MPPQVYLADHHPIFVTGLSHLLMERKDFALTGSASNRDDAIRAVEHHRPQVVVIDLDLADSVTAERLREHSRLLILGIKEHEVYRAVQRGASGFLLRTTGFTTILKAIQLVANGETVIPRELVAVLVGQVRNKRISLTPRELEILQEATHGKSIRQMARELHINESTVKTHLKHIYQKLEVKNLTSAVSKAIREGIVD